MVYYIGFSTALGGLHVNCAKSDAVGEANIDGTSVGFVEFPGVGKPGFSGGPVFDEKGRVVAIMREAWEKKGLRGGDPILINRAFSVELLRTIYNDVQPIGGTADMPSNKVISVHGALVPAAK